MTAATNAHVAGDLYAAFARRDLATVLAVLDPDVVWSEPDNPINPAGGTRHGHAGFMEWARLGNNAEEIVSLEPRRFLADGDMVAVVGHTQCRVRATGKSYETDFVHLITFTDGRIVKFQELFDTYAAAEAFRAS